MKPSDFIRIRGASHHNLKRIDLDIPRNKITVITGLSGSGKSSLAFDTIYAEGQRRYVESLSPYARQFLEQMEKPDVDLIEGLSPSISIDQRTPGRNPRSTVGTMTEINDFLRLLFARVGIPHCAGCGREISASTVRQIAEKILEKPGAEPVTILSPVLRNRKGEHRQLLDRILRKGFLRARIDGKIVDLDNRKPLKRNQRHTVEVIIDRVVPRPQERARLLESLEMALSLAEGLVTVIAPDSEESIFSEYLGCPECDAGRMEMSPRAFSFNSPYGACSPCDGLGVRRDLDPGRIVPDPGRSIAQGALSAWRRGVSSFALMALRTLGRAHRFDLDLPYRDLPDSVHRLLLYGSGTRAYDFEYSDGPRRWQVRKPFEGVIPNLWRRYRNTTSSAVREEIEQFMSLSPCAACKGLRLKPESLAVLVSSRNIAEYSAMEITRLLESLDALALPGVAEPIARPICEEMVARVRFLVDVGIGYLTLDRPTSSLSAGEIQRIRLASQLGSRLTGVIYVLDEPSIGLHQRDHRKLLSTLGRIRDLGNTVIVVEHDEETIRSADFVVDLGPGAGREGGRVVAAGSPRDIEREEKSLTGAYLSGRRRIPVPSRRRARNEGCLVVRDATHNNLKGLDVEFPLRTLTVVTGVSGSGKSSLVNDILFRALARRLNRSQDPPGQHRALEGVELIDQVVQIDAAPIGRTPRSNPATYSGLFLPIRELFSQMAISRMRGYSSGRFSFNVKGGRCEECRGEGTMRIEMHFLPDIHVTCKECGGKRYSRETLDVRFKGKRISDVLEMNVQEALEFFGAVPILRRKLQLLAKVGLDYLTLGQPATTLSGGEAQRLKLARELGRAGSGHTLYILDEPTSGLHFDDIQRLISVLQELVDAGNSVVMIEHNLEVIKVGDWIIDLGPEGGDQGGRIVAEGTPEEVSVVPGSITGKFLRDILIKNEGPPSESFSA